MGASRTILMARNLYLPQPTIPADEPGRLNYIKQELDKIAKWTGQVDVGVDWVNPYVYGDYYHKDQMVFDQGWTMIANKGTTDRAAPQPVGESFYVYSGVGPTSSATVKQIIFGNRYTFGVSGYLNGYRIYTISGNRYTVASIDDPTGIPKYIPLVNFTATQTGWTEFAIDPKVILAGSLFDLIALVAEPDPTPTEFTGDWNYLKPNNSATPLAGQIVHASKELTLLKIHYTDDAAGDRSVALKALSNGDVIEDDSGFRWSIQDNTDNTTYATFTVAPAQQSGAIGVREFTFETVTATPITRMYDLGYWDTNPHEHGLVRGLYIEDGLYEDIVPNASAYGTDILVQDAEASPDWDLVSTSSVVGSTSGAFGGGGDSGILEYPEGVGTLSVEIVSTTNNSWTTIATETLNTGDWNKILLAVSAKRTDAVGYHAANYIALDWYDAGANCDEDKLGEVGDLNPMFRCISVGDDVQYQVRGVAMQNWDWTLRKYRIPLG
jgi:hypothetical protein